jgi:hypothetical protein
MFSVRGTRRAPPLTARRAAASCALLFGLSACGGGDTVDDFSPQRLLVFGDESSLITSEGLKYSVNGLDPVAPAPEPGASAPEPVDNFPPGPVNCFANRVWVQKLAQEYGFAFKECNGDAEGTPQRGVMYAAVDATVKTIADQIAVHEAADSFKPTDLVTVFVGQHDILAIYEGVTAASQCRYEVSAPDRSGSAAREARAQGEALAVQINAIARGGNGGRVLFVTVPNQGATPFARQAPTEADPRTYRRECLSDLTDAFNAGLRFRVVQDGRQIGLVAIDERVEQLLDDNDRFDFDDANVSDAACRPDAPLPTCTTDTLIDAAQQDDFLWADDLHFGAKLHDLLGDLAESRVRNNPF